MTANLASIIAEAWDHVQLTMPDPWRRHVAEFFGGPKRSYRELLDEPEINFLGQIIPRIERVKRNIRRLGDPHLPPSRIPS